MNNFVLKTTATGIGDCICCTPIIRKLSKILDTKIIVYSYRPDIFKNLPYVSQSILLTENNTDSIIDLYNTDFRQVDLSEIPFIPIQHPLIDIRQFPAVHAGLYLLTDELHCDYIPIEKDDLHWYALPKEFVVVHAPQYGSSNIKNWDINNWKALCKSINLPIVYIGKDSSYETESFLPEGSFSIPSKLDNVDVINLTNSLTLDQSWHLCNKAKYVITTDSGILHLAGTTDTEIIYIAMGRNPYFTAPYRKGSQNYKMKIISNNCDWCMSNSSRTLKNAFASNNSSQFLKRCFHVNKPCQPSVNQVLEVING